MPFQMMEMIPPYQAQLTPAPRTRWQMSIWYPVNPPCLCLAHDHLFLSQPPERHINRFGTVGAENRPANTRVNEKNLSRPR